MTGTAQPSHGRALWLKAPLDVPACFAERCRAGCAIGSRIGAPNSGTVCFDLHLSDPPYASALQPQIFKAWPQGGCWAPRDGC